MKWYETDDHRWAAEAGLLPATDNCIEDTFGGQIKACDVLRLRGLVPYKKNKIHQSSE
jgi:hypothetical protein